MRDRRFKSFADNKSKHDPFQPGIKHKAIKEERKLGSVQISFMADSHIAIDQSGSEYINILIPRNGVLGLYLNGEIIRATTPCCYYIFSEAFSIHADTYCEYALVRLNKNEFLELLRAHFSEFLACSSHDQAIKDKYYSTISTLVSSVISVPNHSFLYLSNHLLEWLQSQGDAMTLAASRLIYAYAAIDYLLHSIIIKNYLFALKSDAHTMNKIDELCEIIIMNLYKNYTINDLVKMTGLNRRTLHNAFVQRCGSPPIKWIMNKKLEFARSILSNSKGEIIITKLSEDLHFTSPSRFSQYYRRSFKETPRQTLLRLRHTES